VDFGALVGGLLGGSGLTGAVAAATAKLIGRVPGFSKWSKRLYPVFKATHSLAIDIFPRYEGWQRREAVGAVIDSLADGKLSPQELEKGIDYILGELDLGDPEQLERQPLSERERRAAEAGKRKVEARSPGSAKAQPASA